MVITYVRKSDLSLNVYADTDYANEDNDRRSVSRIAMTLGGTVVSHASKMQCVVSLSTSEAKYMAAGDGVKEVYLCMLFCLSLRPRCVGQVYKSLRTNRGQSH